MTIRPRSTSYENLPDSKISQERENSLIENGLNSSEAHLDASFQESFKKIKTLSIEAFQANELNSSQTHPSLGSQAQKDRDYKLMSNPDVPIHKIRYITAARWNKAIKHEPNHAALLFNYGRVHPFLNQHLTKILKGDMARALKNRRLNSKLDYCSKSQEVLLNQRLREYLPLDQYDLYNLAVEAGLDSRFYQKLTQDCRFIDYTALGQDFYRDGTYSKTLDINSPITLLLKLIMRNPQDDMNYVVLGKLIQYHSMIFFLDPSKQLNKENILSSLGMKEEKGLFLKALEINPLNDEAYVGIGLFENEGHGTVSVKPYLQAFLLNPYNLEAAILLEYRCDSLPLLDGRLEKIGTALENAIQHTPHYLATAPHWDSLQSFRDADLQKKYHAIILKKFINSSLEKHIKHNALKSLIHSVFQCEPHDASEEISNLLFFLSQTRLVSIHEDRELIEHHFNCNIEWEWVSLGFTAIFAEFLKTHFSHEEETLKELIPFFIKAINQGERHLQMAYYYLATLISPHETIEIKGEKFTQEQLYFIAAHLAYQDVYGLRDDYYLQDIAAKILGYYAEILEEEEREKTTSEEIDQYLIESFPTQQDGDEVFLADQNILHQASLTKKDLYSKALSIAPQSAWPYFYLGKRFKRPIEIKGKRFNSSQELFLTALDVGLDHAETYYHLGNQLPSEESITLLNGITLTCQQLYTRAIQLGIQEPDAYFQAAKLIKKGQAILLLDDTTYLSKIDLLFKAFSLSLEPYYLNQIVLYLKKQKATAS